MNIQPGEIGHIIQLAIAPAFLLTGVGTNMLVLTNRPKAASTDDHADILLLRSAEYAGAGAAMPPVPTSPQASRLLTGGTSCRGWLVGWWCALIALLPCTTS